MLLVFFINSFLENQVSTNWRREKNFSKLILFLNSSLKHPYQSQKRNLNFFQNQFCTINPVIRVSLVFFYFITFFYFVSLPFFLFLSSPFPFFFSLLSFKHPYQSRKRNLNFFQNQFCSINPVIRVSSVFFLSLTFFAIFFIYLPFFLFFLLVFSAFLPFPFFFARPLSLAFHIINWFFLGNKEE